MGNTTGNTEKQISLTSTIVSAYVTRNSVPASELPSLIVATYAALTKLGVPLVVEPEKRTPPISIRKTITSDHIISLEDGKPYKTLKRHLAGRGLTPEQYREKWGLPHDYPMVAATYAATRSELAKSSGLGQARRDRAADQKAKSEATTATPARRDRSKKPGPSTTE